jgi:hypothetical protein
MPRQARKPRRPRTQTTDDLDRLATKDMTPEEKAQHQLAEINRKAERLVELGAFDLEDAGATSYAAALRMQIVKAIDVLSNLRQPDLVSDLERVIGYCHELIAEVEKPTPTAA